MAPPLIQIPMLLTDQLFYFPSFVLTFYIRLITNFSWFCLFSLSCILSYFPSPTFIALVRQVLSMPGIAEKWKIRHGFIYRTHSWSSLNVEWKNKLHYTESRIIRVKGKETLNVIITVNLLCFPSFLLGYLIGTSNSLWSFMIDITIHPVAQARKLPFYKTPSYFSVICYQIPNGINIISYTFHKCLFFSFCTITIMLNKAIITRLNNCCIALFISV